MRHKLFLALLLTIFCGAIQAVEAQNRERQKVQIHQQKKFARSKLTIKFVSLIEDSRCPEGVDCVWAGNAKIKIEVGSGGKKQTFQINTNLEPNRVIFNGYSIELASLEPAPKENVRINRNGFAATFSVTRLTRQPFKKAL